MKKRWLSLLVENESGVLARISGLFSAKLYNLDSLTVGTTQDPTISKMTISLTSDDQTFEQVKKQLNRSVEVIKVIDLTDLTMHKKELMYLKIHDCKEKEIAEIFRFAEVYQVRIIEYNMSAVLIECLLSEDQNNLLISLLAKKFKNRIDITRGGSVAIEGLSI